MIFIIMCNVFAIICMFYRLLMIYIYIYIRLKIKPNSVRIRFQSCQVFVLPSTGFELTPLIHCSTIRLALRPVPQTTRPHPLHIYIYMLRWQGQHLINCLTPTYFFTFPINIFFVVFFYILRVCGEQEVLSVIFCDS